MPETGGVFAREDALLGKEEGALPLCTPIGSARHPLNYHLRPLRTFMVSNSSLRWSVRTGLAVGRRVLAPLPSGPEALEKDGDHAHGQGSAVQACLHAW